MILLIFYQMKVVCDFIAALISDRNILQIFHKYFTNIKKLFKNFFFLCKIKCKHYLLQYLEKYFYNFFKNYLKAFFCFNILCQMMYSVNILRQSHT